MSDVTVQTAESIRESDALRPVVEQASGWLEAILRESPEPVSADWSLIRQMRTGDHFIELSLAGGDPKLRFNGLFTPAELQDRDFTESSFRSLYSEMLRRRTHQLLQGLRPSPAESAAT